MKDLTPGHMNHHLLDLLDNSLEHQMRVCNKNMANEVGDSDKELDLKNLFMGFQWQLNKLKQEPDFDTIGWPELIDKIKSIAEVLVKESSYASPVWAIDLLKGYVDYDREIIETQDADPSAQDAKQYETTTWPMDLADGSGLPALPAALQNGLVRR